MKKLILIMLVGMLTACSSTVVSPAPANPKDKWVNITDAHNKVVAAFNTSDGKVQYYSDPKEAFDTLLSVYWKLVNDIQAAQEAAKKKAEEPKKKEKKKQ